MRKLLLLAMVTLLVACHEEKKAEPIPMEMKTTAQIEIIGNRASIVRADTTAIVIARDSVADEHTDTIYNIHTKLTLFLDSTFVADAMEDTLSLQLLAADGSCLAQLAPVDSLLADSLMAFLKQETGSSIVINFVGQTEKDNFLQLADAAKATLFGFSFHEFDPERLADPKITASLDQWEQLANNVAQMLAECEEEMKTDKNIMPGNRLCLGILQCKDELDLLQNKMSPKQLERYKALSETTVRLEALRDKLQNDFIRAY